MANIGDALKRAVETKPKQSEAPRGRSRPSSALMNPNRRAIFKYLCLHPCSGIGQISGRLGLSRSSAKWHLDILADSGYVQDLVIEKKSVHCPNGFVSLKNMPVFWLLEKEGCAAIYSAILKSSGATPGALESGAISSPAQVRNCLRHLQDFGIVTLVKDGRHARYFPTGRLAEIIDEEKKTRREFQRFLIARLSAEHLEPEVGELKGANIVITVSVLGQKDRIEIPHEASPGLTLSA